MNLLFFLYINFFSAGGITYSMDTTYNLRCPFALVHIFDFSWQQLTSKFNGNASLVSLFWPSLKSLIAKNFKRRSKHWHPPPPPISPSSISYRVQRAREPVGLGYSSLNFGLISCEFRGTDHQATFIFALDFLGDFLH